MIEFPYSPIKIFLLKKMNVNKAGLFLIKKWEGLRLRSYKCSSNVYTIGYGHTGKDVQANLEITVEQAERLLDQDIREREQQLNALLSYHNINLNNDNMYSALISLLLNIGYGNLNKSPLISTLKNNNFVGDREEIEKLWLNHNKSAGKELKGLTNRRKEEINLFYL
jgi:lysozyme